jgi:hypothetical protein
MLGRGRAYIWFLAGLATILAGFWPSFYSAPLGNDGWHIAHALAATAWVLLLIAQSLLIGRGRWSLHRRLGWTSLGLFAALLVTTAYMVWVEVRGPQPFPATVRQQLVFLNLAFLLLFIVVYGLGLARRRTPVLHARLLGSTILIGIGPALARLYAQHVPQAGGLAGGLVWTMWTIEAILLAAILLALGRHRSVRPFPELLAAFLLIHVGMAWSAGPVFAGLLRAAGSPI